jgi:DNA-binding transcriptional ArsR family regulator
MRRQTDPDVRLLGAAADPTRLAILRRLAVDGSACACEFTGCCGVSQPTVSHHLKVLREAGWVSTERRGTWIWYSLQPDAATRLRRLTELLAPPGSAPGASRRLAVVEPGR